MFDLQRCCQARVEACDCTHHAASRVQASRRFLDLLLSRQPPQPEPKSPSLLELTPSRPRNRRGVVNRIAYGFTGEVKKIDLIRKRANQSNIAASYVKVGDEEDHEPSLSGRGHLMGFAIGVEEQLSSSNGYLSELAAATYVCHGPTNAGLRFTPASPIHGGEQQEATKGEGNRWPKPQTTHGEGSNIPPWGAPPQNPRPVSTEPAAEGVAAVQIQARNLRSRRMPLPRPTAACHRAWNTHDGARGALATAPARSGRPLRRRPLLAGRSRPSTRPTTAFGGGREPPPPWRGRRQRRQRGAFVRCGLSECSIESIPEQRRNHINLSCGSKYSIKKLR
ncbi:hypothetical protein BRADI_1g23185v3 [Brachypodium distachyon]|uniref:Uncharacterized protein n=1 Tax=Brachypodium distachyon TaxID=15368 RepID=A0A0Q3GWW2_BRADI|nr:hypothetical protein BRADI_1g23185v3 [Brachypodium distachyon]